jgi:hypothetical protein
VPPKQNRKKRSSGQICPREQEQSEHFNIFLHVNNKSMYFVVPEEEERKPWRIIHISNVDHGGNCKV